MTTMTELADRLEAQAKIWPLRYASNKLLRDSAAPLRIAEVEKSLRAATPASGAAEMREYVKDLPEEVHDIVGSAVISAATQIRREDIKGAHNTLAAGVKDALEALPLPVASLPDREAIFEILAKRDRHDVTKLRKLAASTDPIHQECRDVVASLYKDADAILALHSAPSTKSPKKPQCDGLLTCAAAKHDGVVCPDDTCDWDTGVRQPPSTKSDGEKSV